VSRLMREYPNLWADLSAGSGYNALTRDPSFGIEFLDEFQDKLMFGTDSCLRSDVKKVYPNVDFIRRIEEEKKISKDAVEKIKWKNAVELFKLKITD
jgi:predicted TIM-barrel fold metal-dependent hydrolase